MSIRSGKDSSLQPWLLLVLVFWVLFPLIIHCCLFSVVWSVLAWEVVLYCHPGFWSSFLLLAEAPGWLFFQRFGPLEQFLRLHLHGYALSTLFIFDWVYAIFTRFWSRILIQNLILDSLRKGSTHILKSATIRTSFCFFFSLHSQQKVVTLFEYSGRK